MTIISQSFGNLRDAVMIVPTANDFPNIHDVDLAKSHVVLQSGERCRLKTKWHYLTDLQQVGNDLDLGGKRFWT
jgi:hypothetical protein